MSSGQHPGYAQYWRWIHGGEAVPIKRGGVYQFPAMPEAGAVYKFEGNLYRWYHGQFFDLHGVPVDLPVRFVLNPFLHIGESAQGVPQPVWSCCQHTASANPGVMTYHIDQMRLVRVGAYMARNTTLAIPITDSDGVPYLGPEIPPMVILRWNYGGGEEGADTVGGYTTGQYSDRYTGCRPAGVLGAVTTTIAFYYELQLEKEPAPHWVIRLHYACNGTSGADNRTVVADCIGQMVGNHTASYVEVGSSGTAGHYRVERIFTGHSWLDDTSSSIFNERRFITHHVNVSASGAGAIYLTDTGALGGNNLFHASVMPAVRVLGHVAPGASPGANRQNWQSSSHGLGFNYPVGIYGDPPISTAGQDYHFQTGVMNIATTWTILINNASSTYARDYHVFAFGKRA